MQKILCCLLETSTVKVSYECVYCHLSKKLKSVCWNSAAIYRLQRDLSLSWPNAPTVFMALVTRSILMCTSSHFFPSSCCSDNGRHHLVPCIVLFTSIIKSIYIMKLQLTHTHRVACWNTKKGRFVFLCFVRVVMGFQCFWIGKRYCVSFCTDLVYELPRNAGILHLLVFCKHTGDSAFW